MHDGCGGSFENAKQVLNKVRAMGFSEGLMPMPFTIDCDCGREFLMETFESKCPHCSMIYAVTPCHAFDPSNVMKVGKE